MSRKKTLNANSVNEIHGNIEFEQPAPTESCQFIEDNAIYLRDTLIQMDEFKKYGLNEYFLRAILKENYYTLKQARKLVQDFLDTH